MELNINLKLKKEDYNIITYFLNSLEEEQLMELVEKINIDDCNLQYNCCMGLGKMYMGMVAAKMGKDIINEEYNINAKMSKNELKSLKDFFHALLKEDIKKELFQEMINSEYEKKCNNAFSNVSFMLEKIIKTVS